MSEAGNPKSTKKVMTASLRRQRVQKAEAVQLKKKAKLAKVKNVAVQGDELEVEHSSSDSDYEPDVEEREDVLAVEGTSSLVLVHSSPVTNASEEVDDGGPRDKTLLESFNNHIAKSIWDNNMEHPLLKCISHSRKMTQWKIDDETHEVVEKVRKSGLYGIAKHSFRWIDYVAVSAFAERWHPETNTFHMPFGEMTITLDDVCHILHVPVVGKCIYTKDGGKDIKLDDAIKLLVDMSIAESEAKDELNGSHSVKLDWLKAKFCGKSTQENATNTNFDDVTRAYLLHLLGCVVMTDKSGTKVSVHYLNALKEVDKLEDQSWGMAILAYLYRQLGIASRKKAKQMSGCLTLLMAWIYDHFPNIISTGVPNPKYVSTEPRMCKWETTQQGAEARNAIIRLREKLDDLTERDVVWDPYKDDRTNYPLNEYTFYNGLINCFDIAEPYYPDRVLRQFGLVQYIPKDPMIPKKYRRGDFPTQYKVEYDLGNWYGDNWENHVLNPELRRMAVTKPWDCRDDYKSWYFLKSHPIVQNPNVRKSLPDKKSDVSDIMIDATEKAIETMNETLYDSGEDDVNVLREMIVKVKGILVHALTDCGRSSYIKRKEEIRSKKRNEPGSLKTKEAIASKQGLKKNAGKKK